MQIVTGYHQCETSVPSPDIQTHIMFIFRSMLCPPSLLIVMRWARNAQGTPSPAFTGSVSPPDIP